MGAASASHPPKKGAGGGAPSLVAAEVGRDRSQPPFSAFGADGRGHRQKKKKKKNLPADCQNFRQACRALAALLPGPKWSRGRGKEMIRNPRHKDHMMRVSWWCGACTVLLALSETPLLSCRRGPGPAAAPDCAGLGPQ